MILRKTGLRSAMAALALTLTAAPVLPQQPVPAPTPSPMPPPSPSAPRAPLPAQAPRADRAAPKTSPNNQPSGPQREIPPDINEWARLSGEQLQREAGMLSRAAGNIDIGGNFSARISFTIHPDGSASDIRLVKGTGNIRLDSAIMHLPGMAAPFPAFSPDMGSVPRPVVAPVQFWLGSTPPHPPGLPPGTRDITTSP